MIQSVPKETKITGGEIRPFIISEITRDGNDRFIKDFESFSDAYYYLHQQFPYIINLGEEDVNYSSPYGSRRIVYQADIGMDIYYCIWTKRKE